jgi:hypothetical protein
MSGDPSNHHLDLEAEFLRIGCELTTPALEDEGEGGDWRRIMENTEHNVVEGELNQKILRVESMNREAVAQDVEAARDPASDIWQLHLQAGTTYDRNQH